MAAIELNNLTNQIYFNVKLSTTPNPFPFAYDYFVLNPFDENGILSLNEMNIIIDLQEIWNAVPFIFFIPNISALSSLNFCVNVTCYGLKPEGQPLPTAVAIGNDNDNWDNGGINYKGGVMTWTPTAITPISQTYGWWLVKNSSPVLIPVQTVGPETPALLSTETSPDLSTPQGFKQLFSQNSQQ